MEGIFHAAYDASVARRLRGQPDGRRKLRRFPEGRYRHDGSGHHLLIFGSIVQEPCSQEHGSFLWLSMPHLRELFPTRRLHQMQLLCQAVGELSHASA